MTFAASALTGIDFDLALLHWLSVAVLELFYSSQRQMLLAQTILPIHQELEPHQTFQENMEQLGYKEWWDENSPGQQKFPHG